MPRAAVSHHHHTGGAGPAAGHAHHPAHHQHQPPPQTAPAVPQYPHQVMRLRVACRVRPRVPADPPADGVAVNHVGPSEVHVGRKAFKLAHVLDEARSSEAVFAECVAPAVDDALSHGTNAAAILYGQTGAGKTHTLLGCGPLLCKQLVDRLGGDVARIRFSALEVLADRVFDLLAKRRPVQVFDRDGASMVSGATTATIDSADDLLWLFSFASQQRACASTGMNEASSRSHAIFTFFIDAVDGTGNHQRIELVDLAGSERNKKTKNTGLRFQESVGINGDLLALGNVLRSLAKGTSAAPQHIPFRSCKLTRLLRPCFSGACETVFLACVSPTSSNADESMRTLQYAALAAEIKIEVAPPPPPPPAPPAVEETPGADEFARPPHVFQRSHTHQPPSSSSPAGAPHQRGRRSAGDDLNSSLVQQLDSALRQANADNEELARALRERDVQLAEADRKADALEGAVESLRTDLRKDEVIFADKLREIKRLQRRCAYLEEQLHQPHSGGGGDNSSWNSSSMMHDAARHMMAEARDRGAAQQHQQQPHQRRVAPATHSPDVSSIPEGTPDRAPTTATAAEDIERRHFEAHHHYQQHRPEQQPHQQLHGGGGGVVVVANTRGTPQQHVDATPNDGDTSSHFIPQSGGARSVATTTAADTGGTVTRTRHSPSTSPASARRVLLPFEATPASAAARRAALLAATTPVSDRRLHAECNDIAHEYEDDDTVLAAFGGGCGTPARQQLR